ncbi:MAG: hypothetical protein HZB40_00270 [Rhodocyclales bacterium]|nr:hypothetical protein [Rhodocyclales bacterium]
MSPAGRFMLAYDAAHALAFAALRARGYRPDAARGHRAVVFQTREVTVAAPRDLWVALDRYHTRRNASEYSGVVEASKRSARPGQAARGPLHKRLRWLIMSSSIAVSTPPRLIATAKPRRS